MTYLGLPVMSVNSVRPFFLSYALRQGSLTYGSSVVRCPLVCRSFYVMRSICMSSYLSAATHVRHARLVHNTQFKRHNVLASSDEKQLYHSQPNGTGQKNTTFSFVAIFTGLVGVVLATGVCFKQYYSLVPSVQAAPTEGEGGDRGIRPSQKWNFIADVVDKAGPAVVYIEVQARHRFYNQVTPVSNGSGFIVRSDGLVLTNAHVVGNNKTVSCVLQDGRRFEASIMAVDPISDLATVKISAKDLPTLKLGDSSRLRPGEWVVAMGSPFQLSNTVTAGIISSALRGSKELGIHNKDINYIQTDATINFGNSGGPLVNLDGEAIGINTMMVTTGISFAIPSDYAKIFLKRAESIEKRSETKGWFGTSPRGSSTGRGYIGITMLSLSPDLIAALRLRHPDFPDVDRGVLVHKVAVGSPAHNAGVSPGDIIMNINDVDVHEASDIYSAIEKTTELLITVRRGPKSVVVKVVAESVR